MQTVTVQIPSEYKELFNPQWRNILFYGGRASGKSHSVARALILRGRQKQLRILCTREYQNSIKDSVHKLLADIIDQYGFTDYEVQKDSIRNRITKTEFIFKGLHNNTNEIKSTEGIDICWCEEAQSLSKESLEILSPTIRKAGSQLIFTFNRFTELDPVYVKYVLNPAPNTYYKHVNYDVLERIGLLPDVTKMEIEADRANPSLFAHKWLGEPLSQAEMSIIDRDNVLAAMQRTVEADGVIEVGADIARMGSDRTVFFKRQGLKTLDMQVHSKLRTTQVCDALEKFANFNTEILIKPDDTGVGGGVTDEMIKRGYNVLPINFGGEPADKDKYPNLISEAWFQFAEVMPHIELPMHSDLLMELTTRQWQQDVRGRRRVESKSEYKKRGFRSPDIADAAIIAFYTPKVLSVDDFYL